MDRQEGLPQIAKREVQRVHRPHRKGHSDERILELENARFLRDEKSLDDDESDGEKGGEREGETHEAPPRGWRKAPPRLPGRPAAATSEQLAEAGGGARGVR